MKDQKYIDILEDHVAGLDENQDLLSTLGDLNSKLKQAGWPKRAEDLITDVFYSITNKRSEYRLEELVEFLKVVPTGLKTRQMSDENVMELVPESDWGYFRPKDWIQKHTKVAPNEEMRSIR